jgi:threonyl-tRNA synthetase
LIFRRIDFPPIEEGTVASVIVSDAGQAYRQSHLYRVRHSAAHVMADAVQEIFPDAELAIGPPIDDGFYYDFRLPRSLTTEDLADLEERMRRIIATDVPFERTFMDREAAIDFFTQQHQPFKVEIIRDLPEEGLEDGKVSIYRDGKFLDLCRGPHVARTGEIGAIKLLSVAGAYWRGDEHRPMLQRIYGTAFETAAELDQFLWRRAEAERRDHRRLGKELELFHFDPTAPGMPYWLPKGFKLLTTLIDFWRQEHEQRGYQEIATPLINDRSLWETSGHWENYQDNMFLIPIEEHTTYGVKPMNCPNAMVVFNLKTRSYRDLPLRLSDCDPLHRYERSGTLHGLLRVQKFQQDDAHIFVTEEQIEEEYRRIFEIADRFYSIFGLSYTLRLGTRPEKSIGDRETWDRAEAALLRILDERVGRGNYQIAAGDGAFYGPKIDILMEDVLGRSWQMGTIQLDFQLPRRFGCVYADKDGALKPPVVIHRVIYGSLERFIGILIEHTAGAFPVWLAPVQAVVLPIADRHNDYAQRAVDQLRAAGLRVQLDDRREKVQAKIREAQLQKVPYMLVVGDREQEGGTVALRLRTGENLGAIPLDEFTRRTRAVIAQRSLALT